MVEGYMNIPVTIQHHADDVMGILHIPFILCAVQCPLSGMEVPFSKSQEPFRIIVTDVLLVTLRHQRIITEYGSVDGSLAVSFPHFHQMRFGKDTGSTLCTECHRKSTNPPNN